MNRLVHSERAYLRSLQISEKKFFAFVEGGLDRTFYDRMLESLFKGKRTAYQVVAAKELPTATGGKPSLLNYFKSLRRRNNLHGEAFGKKFVCAFFADKDIDDLSRKKMRSPHVIYTKTYDLEGHLLSCGDLARAIADASGITKEQAHAFLGPQASFLKSFVENWKEWTTLCIISQIYNINCGCTFDRISAINPNLTSTTDLAALSTFKTRLREKMEITSTEFTRIFNKYESSVVFSIQRGEPLKYFKAKWFVAGLQRFAVTKLNVPDASINSLGDKVMTALVGQVAIEISTCRCSGAFVGSIRELEQKLV